MPRVQDALSGDSKELCDISHLNLGLKGEAVSASTFSEFSGSCKLEPDTQELGSTFFHNKEVEDASLNDAETVMEISNSTLLNGRQNLPVVVSPAIFNSLSELDSQELNSNNEETAESRVSSADGVTPPKLLGPKLIVRIRKLTEKTIEELRAGIWRCDSCGKTEKSFLMLDLHIDTGCEELSPIECDVCPAVIRDHTNFVCHFMEHQMGEKRRCPICLREGIDDMTKHLLLQGHFSPNTQLNRQENASLGIVQNPFKIGCSISFELTSKAKGLNNQKTYSTSCLHSKKLKKVEKHQRLLADKKPLECDLCKKCFWVLRDLKRHQRVHTGERLFKCNICEKAFSQFGNLNRHQRVHTGEKPFKCDVCKKSFSELSSLNTHRRVHTGEKPFKCYICTKSFSDISNLSRHKILHTGQKPFSCDVCNKCFSMNSSLKTHQRVHTGEKPFKCTVCKKSFSLSGDLKKHQVVHTGLKPFKCDACDNWFSRICSLNRHKRLHTGDKPFKCNICRKTFAQAGYLNNHQKIHLSVKPFKCGVCERAFSFQSNLHRHLKTHSRKKSAT
ncbi:zinc finger protein ZFP2-like isoform X2 [Artemia franciscana]|uniref:C2H2-type domain-containing protein n=1 Tax=Artemia franciscana TaxID=6661 RepID=A0AA88I3G4_ARTSF|nr:hypothetical protein QYM36_003364 [Artemia franciscana]